MLMQSKPVAEPFTNLLIDADHQEVIAKIARKYTRGSSISWEDAAQIAMMKVIEAVKAGKFRQGGAKEFQRWATFAELPKFRCNHCWYRFSFNRYHSIGV
jgi:hypothetical protein